MVTYNRTLTEEEIETYLVDACASARAALRITESTEVYCEFVPVSPYRPYRRRLLAATQYILLLASLSLT
jgi:hypothetical protein